MNDRTTEQLSQLIAARRQKLTQLRDLGLRQSELISSGEISALLRLLAAKQQLLAAVQTIELQLEPFRGEDPDGRVWASPEDRAGCAAMADECRTLMNEIMQMERAHERQMAQRQRDVAGKLQSINAAHQARTAYKDRCGRPRRLVEPRSDRAPSASPALDEPQPRIDLAT